MERDFFMDVHQAVEFGVIDKMLDKREVTDEEDDS
jgi:ATP-dependent Clp protease protease subunit